MAFILESSQLFFCRKLLLKFSVNFVEHFQMLG